MMVNPGVSKNLNPVRNSPFSEAITLYSLILLVTLSKNGDSKVTNFSERTFIKVLLPERDIPVNMIFI